MGNIRNEHYYTITGCKLRRSNGVNLLTTSPHSELTSIDGTSITIAIPDVNFFTCQSKLTVQRINQVGEPQRYKICSHCKKRLECIGLTIKKCENCKRFMEVSDLPSVVSIPIFCKFEVEGKPDEMQLNVREDVLKEMEFDIMEDDQKISHGT